MGIEQDNEKSKDRTINIEFKKINQRYEVSFAWKITFLRHLYEMSKG